MTLVMTAVSGVTPSRGWCQSGGRRTSSKQQVCVGGGLCVLSVRREGGMRDTGWLRVGGGLCRCGS